MAFSKAIGNLIGGISQQPFTQRADNECENQVNFTNSLDDGLIRRSGSYLSNYYENLTEIKAFNPIDIKKVFMIYDQNQEIRVFGDRDNTTSVVDPQSNLFEVGMEEKTVTYENPQTEIDFKNYMGTNPNAGFLNINDATFIYNRDVEVETTTGASEQDFIESRDVVVEDWVSAQKNSFDCFYDNNSRVVSSLYSKVVIDDQYEYSVTSKQTKEQMAKYLASYTRYSGFGPGVIYEPSAIYHVPQEGYVTINTTTSGIVASTVDTNWTVSGFIYKEDDDKFVYHTATFLVPSGSTQTTIPPQTVDGVVCSKWGKIIYLERDVVEAGTFAYVTFDIPEKTGGGDYYRFGLGVDSNKNYTTNIFIPNGQIVECYRTYIDENNNLNITYFDDVYTTQSAGNIKPVTVNTKLISDLPNIYYNNKVTKVSSGTTTEEDDFFVVFKTFSGDDFGNGEWQETGDPDSLILNLSTMPFTAVFDDNNNVTIYDGGWKSRIVGDTETNQDPYFVGNTINELFVYENRLGVLSGGDKVTLSGSGDLFNFYRTTVTTTIPSDRIDFIITSDKLINFKYAIPFQKAMMLIDDNVQYIMSYQGGLSINTLSVQEVANYNTKLNIKPIKTNDSMFFVADYGKNTQLTKFFSKDIQLVDGDNITLKVESLLPNSIQNADISSSNDMIALNKAGEDTVYVFGYKKLSNNAEFNNWTKYKFDNLNIQRLAIFNESMYIFGNYEGKNDFVILNVDLNKNSSLEVMNDSNSFDEFRVGVDNKQLISVSSDETQEFLNIDTYIPFGVYSEDKFRAISNPINSDNRFSYGYRFEIQSVIDNGNGYSRIVVKNPFFEKTDTTFKIERLIIGTLFDSEYEFSKLNLRDRNGVPINSGNTQILSTTITHAKTGGYIVNTEIENSNSYNETFTGKRVGGAGSILGEAFLDTSNFNVYVGADKNDVKIKIKNYDYLPCELQFAEVEVEYSARAGRF